MYIQCFTNQSSVQSKTSLTRNSNLSVLNASLGTTNNSVRGKKTLQKLHLVKGDISAKGPQAGSLAVLIVYLQALAYKSADTSLGQIFIHLKRIGPFNVCNTNISVLKRNEYKINVHLRWS